MIQQVELKSVNRILQCKVCYRKHTNENGSWITWKMLQIDNNTYNYYSRQYKCNSYISQISTHLLLSNFFFIFISFIFLAIYFYFLRILNNSRRVYKQLPTLLLLLLVWLLVLLIANHKHFTSCLSVFKSAHMHSTNALSLLVSAWGINLLSELVQMN